MKEFKNVMGVPFGRAFRSNLFVRSLPKGFPLQSLTQSTEKYEFDFQYKFS